MKKEIIGIVVEFNPLHNGHKRLIDIAKEENPNATLIAAMSGQFVQRGELSIYDKWTRAEAAIDFGVDLVIEIPPFFVLNNANIFAKKSMEIFNEYGANKVYFGSETLSVDEITKIVDLCINDESRLEELKKEYHSLPKAFEVFIDRELNPNDTLGICYKLEATKLGYEFEFNRVVRESNEQWSSASRIRNDLWSGVENNKSLIETGCIRNLDDYTDIIIGKLLTTKTNNDVINYLRKYLESNKVSNFSELINVAHNKSFTKSKLRRETMKFVLELDGSEELIILGSNDKGKDILRDMDNYKFRHSKDNEDNFKVERFITIKSNETLENELSKNTIIK